MQVSKIGFNPVNTIKKQSNVQFGAALEKNGNAYEMSLEDALKALSEQRHLQLNAPHSDDIKVSDKSIYLNKGKTLKNQALVQYESAREIQDNSEAIYKDAKTIIDNSKKIINLYDSEQIMSDAVTVDSEGLKYVNVYGLNGKLNRRIYFYGPESEKNTTNKNKLAGIESFNPDGSRNYIGTSNYSPNYECFDDYFYFAHDIVENPDNLTETSKKRYEFSLGKISKYAENETTNKTASPFIKYQYAHDASKEILFDGSSVVINDSVEGRNGRKVIKKSLHYVNGEPVKVECGKGYDSIGSVEEVYNYGRDIEHGGTKLKTVLIGVRGLYPSIMAAAQYHM